MSVFGFGEDEILSDHPVVVQVVDVVDACDHAHGIGFEFGGAGDFLSGLVESDVGFGKVGGASRQDSADGHEEESDFSHIV